ncbi:MAG: WhiB family transcriptional regulator [Acidimicrobiia bacterium]|nr:WhiB family transcriptional regulator [Acidimicrobiia bacterium]MBP8180869.1 WhiB family transcriptional regulator [Acidimicrobiia bacterium]
MHPTITNTSATTPPSAGPLEVGAAESTETHWSAQALCLGRTHLFFPRPGERPEARERREAVAAQYCARCPVLEPCRSRARDGREYGFWGGESEEQRANAGFQVRLPVGRAARRAARAAREAGKAVDNRGIANAAR